MINGKKILIGISGGIAAYKIPELVRLFKKAGAEVRVCCTKNALEFLTELTLETLSGNKVYYDVFGVGNDHTTEHISLPDWADLMVVAPATANVIGKLASGVADDALTTTFLAMLKPVLVVPAMNEKMWAHPILQRNVEALRGLKHVEVMDTAEGFLACGTTGKGRMVEIDEIYRAADKLLEPQTWCGKRVLLTAGPTQEKLDPVRYISNYSTGKMGYALAELLRKRGAEVILISGPTALNYSGELISVNSAHEMYEACVERFDSVDVAILCAAVADFRLSEVSNSKIKRGKNGLQLDLQPTEDIAAELGKRKQAGQLLVGFALETDNEEENALSKMQRKGLDMIVLNSLRDKGAGFGVDTNKVTIFKSNGDREELPLMSKQEVAGAIIDRIEAKAKL